MQRAADRSQLTVSVIWLQADKQVCHRERRHLQQNHAHHDNTRHIDSGHNTHHLNTQNMNSYYMAITCPRSMVSSSAGVSQCSADSGRNELKPRNLRSRVTRGGCDTECELTSFRAEHKHRYEVSSGALQRRIPPNCRASRRCCCHPEPCPYFRSQAQ